MRSLETAAQAGVLIVAALATIVVVDTVQSGFPAIRSGELPVWGLKACLLSSSHALREDKAHEGLALASVGRELCVNC